MKKSLSTGTGLALVVAIVAAMLPTFAQEGETTRRQQDQGLSGRLDGKTNTSLIRASTLIGYSLVNSRQESVGSIHDIVLDGQTGEVHYIVVTYGGLLGFGNKLFAVPYAALKYQPKPDDGRKHQLILDVTKEQMEGAEGFDEDRWPDFYDEKFRADLKKRYRVSSDLPHGDTTDRR